MYFALFSSAIMIQCVDNVAVVDQEVFTVKRNQVIEWHAPFAFSLDFDSEGNKGLKSHEKGDMHERKLGAASLKMGRNIYTIKAKDCDGDPIIIVEE